MRKIVSNIKRVDDSGVVVLPRAEARGRRRTGRLAAIIRRPELVRNQLSLQSMVLVPVLFVIVFSYLPMWGLLIAFQEYDIFKGVLRSPWVGFGQFRMFFSAREFGQIMRNTIVISFLELLFGFTAPIVLALMINEMRTNGYRRFSQTVTYLPHFLSWVVVAGMAFSLLAVNDGSINIALRGLGLVREPVNWLSDPRYFWGILVTANVWKETGFASIIFLAAIAGVNHELYEAAAVDGAGRLRRIVSITLPCITPQIIVLLILRISNILNAGFQDILLLTNNGTNAIIRSVSEVIDTYVYRVGIMNQRFSYATAAGLFKAVVSVTMLWLANTVSRRLSETSLW